MFTLPEFHQIGKNAKSHAASMFTCLLAYLQRVTVKSIMKAIRKFFSANSDCQIVRFLCSLSSLNINTSSSVTSEGGVVGHAIGLGTGEESRGTPNYCQCCV